MVHRKIDLRTESDFEGDLQIPSSVYWGIKTARAREHFQVSRLKPHPRLIDGMLLVKKACASANHECGHLRPNIMRAIIQTCDEALSGQWRDQFIVDPFQGGAALNANINEVIANRGGEILGGDLGTYRLIDPYKHVNLSQTVNDVFPTAMRVSLLLSSREFEPVLLDLERLLRRKALEFERIVKVGRVCLRDSVPMTLGQEFNAYGSTIERCHRRITEASHVFFELNIGATFVGTGANADRNYIGKVIETLSRLTGFHFRGADDPFRISQSACDFLQFSSALKELATELSKIANDLRLLNSGPSAGFCEIIMPSSFQEQSNLVPGGSQNIPDMIEFLNMVAFQVLGYDAGVALAALSGQLEVNTMTPLISHNILESMDMLRKSIHVFNERCLVGINANQTHCKQLLESSYAMELILGQHIGKEKAAELVQEVSHTGKDLKQLIKEQDLIPHEVLERLFHPKYLAGSEGFALNQEQSVGNEGANDIS